MEDAAALVHRAGEIVARISGAGTDDEAAVPGGLSASSRARPNSRSAAITREKLIEHYQKYYVPSGEWAGIAGDITPRDAAAKMEKALGGWKGGPLARVPIAFPGPIADKKIYVISRPASVQTYLMLSNLAIDRLSPDYIDVQVMNRVLGSGPSSRLFRNIREAKGFTYGHRIVL